jgi:hypothetical protein
MTRSKGGRRKGKKQSKSAVNSTPTGIDADAADHDGRSWPIRSWRARRPIALFTIVAAVTMAGLAWAVGSKTGLFDRLTRSGTVPALAFVGSESCADCHQAESALWQKSQHKHAMQHASAATVLGDFDNVDFDYYGVHSRFFKRGDKFFVETDGSDGQLATFEVKYTFGIEPLQQYLIEFPDGRVQALSIAWDSRSKDQGGQRWFHLYPNEDI